MQRPVSIDHQEDDQKQHSDKYGLYDAHGIISAGAQPVACADAEQIPVVESHRFHQKGSP